LSWFSGCSAVDTVPFPLVVECHNDATLVNGNALKAGADHSVSVFDLTKQRPLDPAFRRPSTSGLHGHRPTDRLTAARSIIEPMRAGPAALLLFDLTKPPEFGLARVGQRS
jgi:hypothetical protein